MALNHIQTKINRLQTTDSKTYEYYFNFFSCYFGEGYEFSLTFLVTFVNVQ